MHLSEGVQESFRSVVAAASDAHDLPSIVAAVVDRGTVVHSVCLGALADGEPPTIRSAYRIASMTKSFTSAAVLQLRDRGQLRLDDPVAAFVPELGDLRGPTADWAPVTVRHLLTMSAGMATDDPWADRHLDATPAEMDRLFGTGATFAGPTGGPLEYSNYGYAMLGRVVEHVSGRTYDRYVVEELLVPLGLDSTRFAADELPVGTRRAWPHVELEGAVRPDTAAPLGHGGFGSMGGLWSSVADVGRWVGYLTDAFPARDVADHPVLRRASRREMQQLHVARPQPMVATDDTGAVRLVGLGYGMGLMVTWHAHLGTVVHHSGGLPGFGSNMRWLPARGVGVVACANLTYAPMWSLTDRLLDVIADDLPMPQPTDGSLTAPLLEGLVRLLNSWDDDLAAEVFADNVAADVPFSVRRRQAAELIDRLGPLRVTAVDQESRTSLTARLAGPRGSAELDLQLSPTVPPKIQTYGVEPDGEPAD